MTDTMFNPPARLVDRIAATEAQPWAGRPMIRGEVHDENAWSLGGVAGHAGLFSTAHDLAVLARTLLNGGRYGHARILEADTVRAMLVNENAEFPGDSHGLGFELDQRWYMDGLSTPVTFGHTGFTGTSVVIDPLSDSFVILLTNRVHPTRDWGSNNPARRAVARDLARAIAVRPLEGDDGLVLRGRRRPHGHPDGAGDAGRRAVVRALVRHRGRLRRPHPRGVHRRRRDLVTACRSRCAARCHDRRHGLGLRRPALARRHGDAAMPPSGRRRAGALALRQRRGQPGPRRLRRPGARRRRAGRPTARSRSSGWQRSAN